MAADVLVPQMGESVLEGTILEWKVKVGDKVKLNQPMVELMTDKVNVEIPAEVEGVVLEILVQEGEVVPVGAVVARIDDGSGDAVQAAPKPDAKPQPQVAGKSAAKAPPPVTPTATIDRAKMSPKVKQMIREYGLDLSTIVPTGKGGRVTVDDVTRAVEARSAQSGFTAGPIPSPPMPAATSSAAPSVAAEPAAPKVQVLIPKFPPLPEAQRETRMPLEGVRKLISEHMVLVVYRKSIKAEFQATYGANLTYIPFIVKAVCVGLKEFPKLNASMTDSEIILKNYYHVGVAVAREEGLIVPVIKDADRKTIVELAVEINDLGEKARSSRLLPDDVAGGTFSITNAGMFGATASTPIINQPQVAILGVHAITKRPWVVDGEIVVRDIGTFGLSFDHRLIDGHVAVQFLHRVHEYLSDPNRLLLHLR
jgi:2-oxoglutarate dehydrogenase E2 component (dihydrolipoamide succinyltransferase)